MDNTIRMAAGTAGDTRPQLLVVDDEPLVRHVARQVLVRAGFDVREAGSGEEAITIVQSGDPVDGVLLDVTMPGMGGAEAFRLLRLLLPDLPVVLTSGYSENDLRGRFAVGSPAGFVQKPFTAATLVAVLRSAILERPTAA